MSRDSARDRIISDSSLMPHQFLNDPRSYLDAINPLESSPVIVNRECIDIGIINRAGFPSWAWGITETIFGFRKIMKPNLEIFIFMNDPRVTFFQSLSLCVNNFPLLALP